MPTYQYRCTECGHDLEVVQKFSDTALTECPNCHGPLRKVFNAVGVVFKGSGFYRTDSRRKEGSDAQGNGVEKDGAAAAKADGKDGAQKSDTPPKTPAKTSESSGAAAAGSAKNGSSSSSSTGTKSSTGSAAAR